MSDMHLKTRYFQAPVLAQFTYCALLIIFSAIVITACKPLTEVICEDCEALKAVNHNPTLAPLAAVVDGQWVRMVKPSQTVVVQAHAADRDGDRLRYRWIAAPNSGSIEQLKSSMVKWRVGKDKEDQRLTVVVNDGKGGYAKETLRLPTQSEVVFAGQVVANDGKPLESVSVQVNDEKTNTDSKGHFKLPIKDANAPRFVLNLSKWGYGLVSRTYDQSVHDGKWTMLPATIQSVDPTRPIIVTDVLSLTNCTGSLTSGINWNDYPQQRIPRITDTFGQLTGGTIPADITQALNFIFGGTDCSPGISINIPANSLVDNSGNPPQGNVQVSLSTVDLYAPDSMPGDYSVQTEERTLWMQSYGAGGINIRSGGKTMQLKKGQTAKLTIPVDPNQLRQKGKIPETIPLLLFNEDTAEWLPRGEAKLDKNGKFYHVVIDHFSEFNTDLIKTDQACLRFSGESLISADGTAGEFELDAIIPLGSAAPVVRNWHISASDDPLHADDPNLHVIVNLPSDTWITLIPMRQESGRLIPYGIFGANSGPPQSPTDPNFPMYPYTACANELVLTDVGGTVDIVVDGTGHIEGPFPIHLFSLTNPDGTDIYPLEPVSGSYALYSLYDSGSAKVRINNILPKEIGGMVSTTDAGWLALTDLATVNVRLNGLNTQDPGTCAVPIGPAGSEYSAQVEITDIATRPYDLDATLIGLSVINQVIAHINYQNMISIPACAGLVTPESGPYMDFYFPGDSGIPSPDLVLTLERFGSTTSTDGATAGQSYWLRNMIFQHGTNVAADDPDAADPIDFRLDTGTTLTIINDRVAGLLGLIAGDGSSNCFGGINNGYVIDSVTAMGDDGTYRIENASICWQESVIDGSHIVDAVIGSNFFDQVQIVFDGVNNTLGIIE